MAEFATDNPHLVLHAEVATALAGGRPVLALESTIITHGMPFPRNLETARAVQDTVRERGVVPACCAVLDGQLRVGLEDADLERLARLGHAARKASRRDLALLMQGGHSAGTTVAATMIIAAMAGIRVFATGGIGGVHRDVQHSMDVSADLQELSRTDVAVVCAGAKSILDIGKTLEYLETHGVPVLGFRTDRMPAFFCRDSGSVLDQQVDSAAEVAAILRAKWDMGLSGGVVIANPIPEPYAMDFDAMEAHIEQALAEAKEQSVTGKDLTPFLLARVETLTGGDSLQANIQLVLSNARLGADISRELAEL